MKIKIGSSWFEPTAEAPAMVVLTPKEKSDIANMAPDATMYAVFTDDCALSSNDRLAWMTQPDPATTAEGRYSLLAGHPIPIHQADTPGVDEPPRFPEDKWTGEQNAAAEARLTGGLSLADRVALLGQGACTCNTKSPDVHMHLPTCRYRQAMALADEVDDLVQS